MNAAATSIGGSGAIQWAEGGISYGQTSITPGGNIFAEKPGLVEAFVPISDRAAGLRILPQVMRELGVRTFASGGMVGHGSSLGGFGSMNITVINNSKTAVNERKLAKEIESRLTKKMYEAAKK